jgi:outer membrane protein assembly factor BamD
MNRHRLPILALLAIAALPCARAAAQDETAEFEFRGGRFVPIPEPVEGTAAGELELIRGHIREGEYRSAVSAAEDFLKNYPGEQATEEVLYLAGEAYRLRGRYFDAFGEYQKLLESFPNGQFSQRALERCYEIGDAFVGGRKRIWLGFLKLPAAGDGLEILNRVFEFAPGSALAEKALLRIADYHFDERDYPEAAAAYDRFIEQFPASTRAPYARLQAARATYAYFRDVRFDLTPLLDARQRFRAFQDEYPAQARQASVARTLREIHETLADRELATAEFYRRADRLPAARHYYRRVVEEYPGTEAAAEARRGLEDLPARTQGLENAPVGTTGQEFAQ